MAKGFAIEHGDAVDLPLDGVAVTGSPLFEKLLAPSEVKGAILSVAPFGKLGLLRAFLVDPDTKERTQMPDAPGAWAVGTRSFTFQGSACGGVVAFQFQRPWSATDRAQHLDMRVDFTVWEGVDVRRLPYFEATQSLIDGLAAGCTLEVKLLVEGQVVASAKSKDRASVAGPVPDEIIRNQGVLNFVADLRSLTHVLDRRIDFRREVPITGDDWMVVKEAIRIAERRCLYRRADLANPITFCVPNQPDGLPSPLLMGGQPQIFRMTEPEGRAVQVFGQELKLPIRETYVVNAVPQVTTVDNALHSADLLQIELLPAEGFSLEHRFVNDSSSQRAAQG